MPPKPGKISDELLDDLQRAVARRQHSFADVTALLARYDVELRMRQYTFSKIVRGIQLSTTPENVEALQRYIGLVSALPAYPPAPHRSAGRHPEPPPEPPNDSRHLEELSEVHFHTRRQREALDLVKAMLTRDDIQLSEPELRACILLLHNEGLDVAVIPPR